MNKVAELVRTELRLVLGAVAFTSLGLLLGAVVPNARAAQGIGLLAFFPSFLLGGGGPPPDAMSSAMRQIAKFLPLTHVTASIRQPWLGLGNQAWDLVIVAGVLVGVGPGLAAGGRVVTAGRPGAGSRRYTPFNRWGV